MAMISKEDLGRRVREIRQVQKLTLKDVESISGLSSTHISEIERGMTSPTIGALIRIAHALRKDPSYFVEERELDEVTVTSEHDRPQGREAGKATLERAALDRLTPGVLGGRICAYEARVGAGGMIECGWLREGHDVCIYCLEGKLTVRAGDQEMSLTPGDSIHGVLPGSPTISAGPDLDGRFLLVSDPRGDCP